MKPVIFLDVDGVLAVRPIALQLARPFRRQDFGGSVWALTPRKLKPQAIAQLNTLAALAGAYVVISSSWRKRLDTPDRLTIAGMSVNLHPAWRTDSDGPDRGSEISRWLVANGYPPYVILDDWRQGLESHASHLVHTNYRIGLTDAGCTAALSILTMQGVSCSTR